MQDKTQTYIYTAKLDVCRRKISFFFFFDCVNCRVFFCLCVACTILLVKNLNDWSALKINPKNKLYSQTLIDRKKEAVARRRWRVKKKKNNT